MTARFGRNKRRRAREAIAAVTAQLENTANALSLQRQLGAQQSDEIEELREIIADAKDMAGDLSALFPATERKTHMPRPVTSEEGRYWAYLLQPLREVRAGGNLALEKEIVDRIPLDVLIEAVDRSQLDRRVHTILRYKDQSVAYALSDETALSMRFDRLEREVRRTALPQMLKLLMQYCYPSKGGPRG